MAHRAMLVGALTTAMFAGAWNVAQSQNEPTPAYPQADKHKPSTLADRVVLTYEGDPATSQSVTWRTDATVKTAQAQIARSGEGPAFKNAASTVLATRNVSHTTNLGYDSVYHTVRFTGLAPKSKYLYRLGDGTNWSEWYEFQTASANAEPFSFVYYGDAQNDIQEQWSRVVRQSFKDAPDTKLFVHAGDLIDSSTSDSQWGEWFNAGRWVNGMVPSFGTTGNHEYSGSTLSPQWNRAFAWPENGPQGTGAVYDALKGTAFYTDFQGVRFISLNSNVAAVASAQRPQFLDVQTAWLEGLLKDNPNKWTVVTFHHPMFSNEPARNNPEQRNRWLPILEKYGVDLVLQGHDHSYGRGNVIQGSTTQGGNGTMYVVSVSGPKMYGADESNWVENGARVVRQLTNTQLYQVISVDGSRLTYKAKTATGRLHDQFTIDKPDGQAKIVTDDLANVQPAGVGGSVPGTLSLDLAAAPSLGAFAPGVAKDYEAGVAATITSTAGDATLSVVDTAATAPGKLVNGAFALAAPIQAAVSGAFGPVSGSPLALHSYSGPVSKDPVTIRFKQSIAGAEPLRTGAYSKALTLTLSTTAP
jgi:phosphodiesterase/alkaline phosphatase D-like protein